MRLHLFPAAVLVWSAAAAVLFAGAGPSARAADLKFEAHLVWGTDDSKPPAGKDYKPVDPEIRKKLSELPLKWKNWFEVNKKAFSVPPTGTNVPISDKCELILKIPGGSNVEVALIGKGKEVGRHKQPIAKGELLVLGGPAPNDTGWLVVLKRTE
jgi:hypothetical protein